MQTHDKHKPALTQAAA